MTLDAIDIEGILIYLLKPSLCRVNRFTEDSATTHHIPSGDLNKVKKGSKSSNAFSLVLGERIAKMNAEQGLCDVIVMN
jgi:hypothetical protein